MDFYQTPHSDLLSDSSEKALSPAPLAVRLSAGVLDLMLVFILDMFLLYLVGQMFSDSVVNFLMGKTTQVSKALLASIMLFTLLSGVVIYTLINFRLLKRSGQTIGKKLLGIRVVDLEGRTMPWLQIVLKRFLPFWSVLFIPYIGEFLFLLDVFPVLLPGRRCIHDRIAGSQVVCVN